MDRRVSTYVGSIVLLAALSVVYLDTIAFSVTSDEIRAAACFSILGLVAQVSTYKLLAGASGSIAFLPFLTGAILAPSATTALLVSVAVAFAELTRKTAVVKRVFNVAQFCLAVSLAIIAYIHLGGRPFGYGAGISFFAYCVLVLLFLATNTLAVSGAIAVAGRTGVLPVWRRNTLASIGYDVLSIPVAYCLAVVYVELSIPGVVLLGVLLLGARQLYGTNRQLEQANQELLEVFVAAIELRDPYTSGHSQRVSKYSQTIARAIGLRPKEVERVRVAALLHDVGKIDQRFAAILQKPGRLTDDERAIIELHPVISAELVLRVSRLADVVPSIRHHHERWDGRGYPDGLAAGAIPLFARIITFADTIDAMTSDRPYRPALGAAEVRAELLRNRGKQFDPAICDRLLASPLFAQLFERDAVRHHGGAEPTAVTAAA